MPTTRNNPPPSSLRQRIAGSFGAHAAGDALRLACAKANQANIELRKDNQSLQAQIDQLQTTNIGDEKTIEALVKACAAPATTLP